MYVAKRVSLHTSTVCSSSIVETIVEIAYLFNDQGGISIMIIVISQLSRTVVYFCFCYPHIADNRHQNRGSTYSWLAEYHGWKPFLMIIIKALMRYRRSQRLVQGKGNDDMMIMEHVARL